MPIASFTFLFSFQFVTSLRANPLFFDSIFPSLRSTTESNIADYRQQKRADSSAEHSSSDGHHAEDETRRSNVDFYAEILGKLIGTVRDGVTAFVDTVRQRKQQSGSDESTTKPPANHRNSSESEIINMQMRNATSSGGADLTSSQLMTKGMRINETANEADAIELLAQEQEKPANGNEIPSNQSSTATWREAVQIIARRTKQKRSNEHDVGLSQLEIPIGLNGDGDEVSNAAAAAADWHNSVVADKLNLLAKLKQNHRRRKENLIRLMLSFIASPTNGSTANGAHDDEDDESISIAVLKGNATVVHVLPLNLFKIVRRAHHEHSTDLQLRTKWALQRAFYKYARLFLIARKGYKDARSVNRQMDVDTENASQTTTTNEHDDDDDDDRDESDEELKYYQNLSAFQLPEEEEEVDDEDELNYATSDARSNVEAFAILLLEIFGAMFALTLGAITQIQAAGYFEG